MGKTHTGGCLCGAIKFEGKGDPLWISHCHCNSCRRSTGAPVTTFVGLEKAQFKWLSGTPKTFSSSPGVSRSFCADCGTPLCYEADRCPDEMHMYISVMDRPDDYVPTHHVFIGEKISWLELDDGLERYKGMSRSDG